ncbi:MAG TPA: hypothetical protein VGM07_15700 [Stellaceae bacterium]|jgi:hypothetical protein
MTPYLPDLRGLCAIAVTWGIGAMLLLAGAGLTGRRVAPELQIGAGWGALCLVLTLWGVFVPIDLRVPALAFAAGSLAVLLLPGRRPPAVTWVALGRLLVVSLPLWLIMAPIRPSQPDTFLNLLPNAFYLVDHGRLPSALLPPSFSLLPAAPYDTQFLSYLGALLQRDYPAAGMSLVNIMLQLLAGLAIARALSPPRPQPAAPSWAAVALGLLLATLLNPGFVPRIDFTAYAEPALAATALLAAWLFVGGHEALALGRAPAPTLTVPLALILAAMVDIKQSAIGLVAALGGAALITLSAERTAPRANAIRFVALALLPSVLLYAVWRYWVAHAGMAELTPLPFHEWNWSELPATTASALRVILGKGTYFACVLAAFASLPLLLSRQGWTPTTRLLAFFGALFILYNAFLLVTYVAVFPVAMSEAAHSYFRYNTHLSLVMVLALALAVRDLLPAAWIECRRSWPIAAMLLSVALLAPVVFAKRLRFDLDMPQPLVWSLAKHLKPYLHDGGRLALLLPGDNGSVATMLEGVLADTVPRRHGLDLLRRDRADRATLGEAQRLGYWLALVSCTPEGWRDVPAGEAAILRYSTGGWRLVAAWPYPSDAAKHKWQHILSWEPLCRQSR